MNAEEQKLFRTLRGWLKGKEPDEETYFAYSASLRIFGNIPDLDEITTRLGITPTNAHRRGARSPPYKHDMWSYSPDIAEDEPLEHHINALWAELKPNKEYLLDLKRTVTVDVFLGYRSNCDHAGVQVPHTCLEMFTELEIPFGVSIVIA
ncbi:MAG: DUF4279 domain-containing protein [Planctomycetes bacterium]|nr:DUF4279 domain-containing protein [Planctomycetota bacterium]